MKIQKSKIVMVLIVTSVVLFIVFYSMVTFGNKDDMTVKDHHHLVPKLVEDPQQFEGKLDAIEALKEAQEFNAPSVYDQGLLDSMGYYHSDLDSIQKRRMIDSVYALGERRYEQFKGLSSLRERDSRNSNRASESDLTASVDMKKADRDRVIKNEKEILIAAKEQGLNHQLFFASNPKERLGGSQTTIEINVRVDGTQVLKKDFRLNMRLAKGVTIAGQRFDKNTPVYGSVSFKPNRTMIHIEHIGQLPVELSAYDLQDGSEGIYIKNSFRADASQQFIGDVVDDINLAGVPQVSGIKQLFRRSNRQVKVTVMDGFQLTLKRKQ